MAATDLQLGGGGFYITSDDITFEPAAEDRYVNVMVQSTPFGGWTYTAVASVLVKGTPPPIDVWKIVISTTVNDLVLTGNGEVSAAAGWEITDSTSWTLDYPLAAPGEWFINITDDANSGLDLTGCQSGNYSIVFDGYNTISALNNLSSNPTKTYQLFMVTFPGSAGSASITVTYNIKVYKNNNLISDTTKVLSCSGDTYQYDTISIGI
jgi:hypothetical protein